MIFTSFLTTSLEMQSSRQGCVCLVFEGLTRDLKIVGAGILTVILGREFIITLAEAGLGVERENAGLAVRKAVERTLFSSDEGTQFDITGEL
jgi:hypothetical protein